MRKPLSNLELGLGVWATQPRANRKYRGKNPCAIRELWSGPHGSHFCKTNDGVIYLIVKVKGETPPKMGDDASIHPMCKLLSQVTR